MEMRVDLPEPLLSADNGVNGATRSADWDEVNEFCERVYMPYRVRPLRRASRPDARMHLLKHGRIRSTGFGYGTEVHLSDFDPAAGNVLVLTTMQGSIEHGMGSNGTATTRACESFVTDCSRTDYWLRSDVAHRQLNLTIPHDLLEEVAINWFGATPGDALWTRNAPIGGPGSAFLAQLEGLIRGSASISDPRARERFHRHMEASVCAVILQEWSQSTGVSLGTDGPMVCPGFVRRAEDYLAAHAKEVPTLTETAAAVGVSVRGLSDGFRRYRNQTPGEFLAEQRLQGVHKELCKPSPDATVTRIATDWGYVNLSHFARQYQRRFGQLPAQTLRSRR